MPVQINGAPVNGDAPAVGDCTRRSRPSAAVMALPKRPVAAAR